MKKIIVAPDSFKGAVSSKKACDIMAEALEKCGCFEVVKMPLADGGEGTLDIVSSLDGSAVKTVEVFDPLGRAVNAEYIINKKTAIIESARACGLTLLSSEERNPLFTTTYGAGQIVSAALSEDINEIVITLGGSSTNDCGAGFLAALGAKFTGENISRIPCGKDLGSITDINLDGLDKRLKNVRLTAVCDVENPLYGKNGAAYVFAPQKGADEKTVEILDEGLKRFSDIIKKKTGADISFVNGAGASGGLAAALILLGAEIKKGAETVLSIVGFDSALISADYVFTGEGSFDRQSFMGKTVGTVYAHSRKKNVPVAVFAGEAENDGLPDGIKAVSINPEGASLKEAMENTEANLYNAVIKFVNKEKLK